MAQTSGPDSGPAHAESTRGGRKARAFEPVAAGVSDRTPAVMAFTTDSVDERDRFDFWRDVICSVYAHYEVNPLAEVEQFHASVTGRTVDSLQVSRLAAGPTPRVVARTPATIARATEQSFLVALMLNGTGLFVQGDRMAVLRPGDLVVLSNGRPYAMEFAHHHEMALIQVPRALMLATLPGADTATATAVNGLAAGAVLVRGLVDAIMDTADGEAPAVQQHLATAAIELVAASLADQISLAIDAPMRAAHLTRARKYIEQNLWNPDLSPEAVARAVFISERHLHAIFRDSGTSVARYLTGRRLERAHRDLADPGQAHLAIADIAYQNGFKCPKHFTKVFRVKFGVSPREHRNGAQSAAVASGNWRIDERRPRA